MPDLQMNERPTHGHIPPASIGNQEPSSAPSVRAMQWLRLLSGRASTSVFVRVTAAALSFLVCITAARSLSIADYGVLSMLIASVNLGAVIALLGHETLATRVVAATPDNADAVSRYRAGAVRALRSIAIITGVIIVLGFFATGRLRGGGGLIAAASFACVPFCVARARFVQGLVRGRHLPGLALVPDGLARPALTIVLMALTLPWVGGRLWLIAADMALAALFALFLALAIERRLFDRFEPATPKSHTKGHRDFSAQIYLSSLLTVFYSQVTVLFVGHLAGSGQAALYDSAARFATVSALISQTLYVAISPRIARYYALDNKAALRTLLRRYTRLSTLATAVIALILAGFSFQLLQIFGAAYTQAGTALKILLLSVLVSAASGPTGMVLLMTGHESLHSLALTASLVFQIVLCFILIPPYGFAGAAVAVLASTIIWNVLMMGFIHSRLGLRPALAWA